MVEEFLIQIICLWVIMLIEDTILLLFDIVCIIFRWKLQPFLYY